VLDEGIEVLLDGHAIAGEDDDGNHRFVDIAADVLAIEVYFVIEDDDFLFLPHGDKTAILYHRRGRRRLTFEDLNYVIVLLNDLIARLRLLLHLLLEVFNFLAKFRLSTLILGMIADNDEVRQYRPHTDDGDSEDEALVRPHLAAEHRKRLLTNILTIHHFRTRLRLRQLVGRARSSRLFRFLSCFSREWFGFRIVSRELWKIQKK
jgi:hypothetical protein